MSRFCCSGVTMLLSISVSMVILVVECVDQQIPGPHYPIATGAPGDELVYTGTTPSFLSYHAVDNEGNDRVYVPVYTAVYADAGESAHKDVHQNLDKTISIQGNGEFWCAFGHPYRQFAFQDKYKWQQFTTNFKPTDARIPAMPLIRCFLVEAHVVKDIMLQSTTEPYNKIAGVHDINVDHPATNQFGINAESKSRLEAFALPGSLVTYVEDLQKLSPEGDENKYAETLKSWGEIRDVADLKHQFNVPTELFSSYEKSVFVKVKVGKNKLDISIAKSGEVAEKLNHQNKKKWNAYLSALKQMDAISKPTDRGKVQMFDFSPKPIIEYPSDRMADVRTLIKEQTRNRLHHQRRQQLLDSFELLTKATTKKISWENLVPKTETELKKYNELRSLTNKFIQLSVDFISDTMDVKNIKNIKNVINSEKMKRHQLQWQFCSNLDELKENLKRVSNFLVEKKIFTDFPRGEHFSKSGLYEFFKSSLVSYIQSNEIKLDKDIKNNILRHVNADNPTKRELFYSNDANTDSKIYVGDKNHNKRILFPGDTLSIEIVGHDIDALKIKSYTSDVFDSILSISPPKKVTFTFPDTNLDDTTESKWKKYAVEVGDYLKDNMRVQSIDLTFTDSKLLKYDMISHIIEGRKGKEMPVRLVNGHLVVDDRIAPEKVSRKVQDAYSKIIKDETRLSMLRSSQKSDVLFVPMENGLFLSNVQSSEISESQKVEDYMKKHFEKPIKNEIIVELIPPDVTEAVDDLTNNNKRSPAGEASDMLAAGYRQKYKNVNVISFSATTENGHWDINLDNYAGIETYDDVRITVVGVGDTSSDDGVWKIGGQNSETVNDLVKQIKQKLNMKGHGLRKVSVVACNPESLSGNLNNNVEAAIKLAKDVANENKVTVSTRVGYVEVDEEGHKWYSATNDGKFHRRQDGDVYVAEWDDKKGVDVIKKTATVGADNIILDVDNKKSGHLGVKQTVTKEHESNIIKGGFDISKELLQGIKTFENKQSQEKAFSDNSKVQKKLQKIGNYMSAYGMLQTATYLLNTEKCERNEYTSKEACEARKIIAGISLTQEAIEIVHDVAGPRFDNKKVKAPRVKPVKVSKVGTSFKSFGKSVLRNSLKGLPVLGVGLDIASLGLDIYDLTKAKTPTEKGIAGTSVALSSLSLIAGGTALIAGIVGATAIAAVAGPAALVVGLLSFAFSIGVTIWQTEKYEKEQIPLVNQASKYFESMNSLYDSSWYYCELATLYMKTGIAFKTISLNDRYIEADSEYMCETRRKNWKTNYRIYPLLLGSTICDDYSEIESNCYCQKLGCSGMVNVRRGMGIDERQTMQCGDLNTVVLTSSPIVLRGYSYALFDTYDPVIGLHDKNPSSKFEGRGHSLARQIASKYYNFFYENSFCWDKYAIINNIYTAKNIPSVTNIELGPNNIRLIVPQLDDPSLVTFSITGIQGFVYTVHLSSSCSVVINSDLNPSKSTDVQTLWRIVVDAELVDLSCYSSNKHLFCFFESSHVHIENTQKNQVIIFDANNIISIPVLRDNVMMMYIAEVQASNFSSDLEFLQVMSRYFLSDTIDISMTLIPVKNLSISRCGHQHIGISYLSKENNLPRLHFTSEFQYQCSEVFNTDAKVQLLENDTIYYSSSQYSVVWRTDFLNNSLLSFAKLPCQSNTGSDVSVYVVQDQIYIKQIINIPFKFKTNVKVEALYRLTLTQVFLLFIASDFKLSWENLDRYCFQPRNQIFSAKEQPLFKTVEISAGENDLTFVNTSNEVYWVRKINGNVDKRIVPNLGVRCEFIEISFPDDLSGHITSYKQRVCNDSSTFNDEFFYFLCKNGNHTQMYVQSGNNRAKPINSLLYKNIYIKRNEILLQNETDTFTFDDDVPSKMCLFEYELNLPYTAEESFENLMNKVSDKYGCVESKTKLKFKQLVGWFDFEETVTVIVHESIASYYLKPVGATRDLTKYWIWDTFNQTLYLHNIAEPAPLMRLLVGNVTEHDYQTMIPIPEIVFVNAQEVEYESGRIYVYSSDGATYYVDEEGNSEILAVTDFWFSRHPDPIDILRQNTEKEVVIYRPSEQQKKPNTNSTMRCRRSIEQVDALIPSLIFHIPFEKIFDVDLSNSVYVGSNSVNMSVYTFNYQTKALLELDEDGNVLREERYNIIHRLDQTLIVESCNETDNRVPPIIDGVKTIVLSSSEFGFEFDITKNIWSKVDEILIQEDSANLIINLEMLPCDYDLENIDGRFFLLDYAHRRKLVIPNAEQRSKAGLVVLYACDVQIVLHNTKTYHTEIVFSVAIFLLVLTVGAIFNVWRKYKSLSLTKQTRFVPNTVELQSMTQTAVQREHVQVDKQTGFVPNTKELHLLIQTAVQREHVQVAEHRAALSVQFKGDIKNGKTKHRILTRR